MDQGELLAKCDAIEFSRTTRPYLDHLTTVDAARIGSPTVNAAKHVDMKLELADAGVRQAQSELYNANGHKASALQESIAKAYSDDIPAVSKAPASRQKVTHFKRSNNTKKNSTPKRAQSQTTLDALHQRSAALLFTVKQNSVKLHALVSGPR
jgi:hypothetical protein